RIFFKIFQKAIPVATVPLRGNAFTIDSSINEFSTLIFRKNKADTSKLITPSGAVLSQETTSAQLHWHYQGNYDLVTVKSPEVGEWEIKADIDPDNQVMIVTDLQLRTSVLPNYLNSGEQLAIDVYFTDAQKIITRADFLNFIDLKLQINNTADVSQSYAFIAQLDKPGFFKIQLPEFDQEGIYHLDISANGQSFQRAVMHSLAVLKTPISMTYKIDAQQVVIDFVPDAELVDIGMLHIAASIQAGDVALQNVIVTEQAGQWQLMIQSPEPEQQVQVSFAVQAQSVAGVAITPALQDLLFTHDMFVVESVPLIIEPTEIIERTTDLELQKPTSEVVAAIDQTTETAEESPVEEVQFNWPVIAVVVAVNLLLMIVGYFGFRFYKNKSRAQQAEVLERLE
ncbi:MAG: hypothetical protein GQ581_04340, partial [Methyloprofundus sp.]|nr:hypothetical protein [Methyloprofundus sp.]